MSDCQGLAAFAGDAAMLTSSTQGFVQAFGVLTPQQLATGLAPGMSWNTNPVFLNSGQPSGFDSAYQNTLPDNPVTGWNGDQGHHFAAFLQAGYLYGSGTASFQAWALEYWEGLDSGIMNLGDVNLGEAAAQSAQVWWLEQLRRATLPVSSITQYANNELKKVLPSLVGAELGDADAGLRNGEDDDVSLPLRQGSH
jgi:hypothetical protein